MDMVKVMHFLQSRGYKIETPEDAEKFISEMSPDDRASFDADFAKSQEQPTQTTQPIAPIKQAAKPAPAQTQTAATPEARLTAIEKFVEGYRKQHPYCGF